MEFYHRNEEERRACEHFAKWAERWGLTLDKQNAEKAPWHIYAKVGEFQRYPQRIDFYPHKQTAVWGGETFRGIDTFDGMMMKVVAACETGV